MAEGQVQAVPALRDANLPPAGLVLEAINAKFSQKVAERGVVQAVFCKEVAVRFIAGLPDHARILAQLVEQRPQQDFCAIRAIFGALQHAPVVHRKLHGLIACRKQLHERVHPMGRTRPQRWKQQRDGEAISCSLVKQLREIRQLREQLGTACAADVQPPWLLLGEQAARNAPAVGVHRPQGRIAPVQEGLPEFGVAESQGQLAPLRRGCDGRAVAEPFVVLLRKARAAVIVGQIGAVGHLLGAALYAALAAPAHVICEVGKRSAHRSGILRVRNAKPGRRAEFFAAQRPGHGIFDLQAGVQAPLGMVEEQHKGRTGGKLPIGAQLQTAGRDAQDVHLPAAQRAGDQAGGHALHGLVFRAHGCCSCMARSALRAALRRCTDSRSSS